MRKKVTVTKEGSAPRTGELANKVHQVAWQLRNIHFQAMRKTHVFLDGYGLHFGMTLLMHLIEDHPEASQSDLARMMFLTDPAMSGSVKKLVKLGYVETMYDPDDQRRKVLRLTAEGKRVMKACDVGLDGIYDAFFEGLEDDQLDQLSELLARIDDKEEEEIS